MVIIINMPIKDDSIDSLTIYRILRRLTKKRNIILIETAPLPKEVNGLWYLDGSFEVISLNKLICDIDKKAFILAHELGHSCLHRHIGNLLDIGQYDPAYAAEKEREANIYAERLIAHLRKGEEVISGHSKNNKKPISLRIFCDGLWIKNQEGKRTCKNLFMYQTLKGKEKKLTSTMKKA